MFKSKITWFVVLLLMIAFFGFQQKPSCQNFKIDTEEADRENVFQIDFARQETIPPEGKSKIVGYNYYGYTYDSISWNRYDEIRQYKTGRVIIINSQSGFVDKSGELLIPVSFDDVLPLYDLENSFLKTVIDTSLSYFNIKGKLGGYGIVDEKGKILIQQKYDVPITSEGITYKNQIKLELGPDGSASIQDNKGLKVEKQGQLKGVCYQSDCEGITYIYRDIYWSSKGEGYIAIDTFQNRVLLDEKGVVLEKRIAKEFKNWDGRYFYTVKEGSAGIYDLLKRSWLIMPDKLGIGLGMIDKGRFTFRMNLENEEQSSVLMIDATGEIIIQEGICERLHSIQDSDLIIAYKGGAFFVLDLNGNTIIGRDEYDEILKYNELILLKKGSKYGVLHPLELVVYPTVIDEFVRNPETADSFVIKVEGEEKHVVFDLREGKYVTKK